MEKTIERQLKEFILARFKSLREFANIAKIPSSTLATIFERGIKSARINTIFQICDALSIDINSLMINKIVEKQPSPSAHIARGNFLLVTGKDGKQTIFKMTDAQLKLIIDIANALTKKN